MKDETIESIAHLYGINASDLYRRNRMEKGTQPDSGSYVYLRGKAPRYNLDW